MQEQEKKNKGFSLLEIIVVLAIVGALAGVGIPNFAKWNNKRIIANASEEVASLLRNIHATTERGTFAYVQLIFESDNEDGISIKTKGVTMDNFTTKMNDTSVSWNTSPDNRCSVTPLDDEFWTSEDTDRDELKANANEMGEILKDGLIKIQSDHREVIGEVRGKGLMVGLELVVDETKKDRTPNPDAVDRLMEETKDRGLLIGRGGLYGNCVRISPSLNIGRSEIDEALSILASSFRSIDK